MSLIAFRTKNYNIQSDSPVTAEECTAEGTHIKFYCPNPKCRYTMILKGINSTHISPHFANISSSPHINNCVYSNSHSNYLKSELDDTSFDLQNLLNEISSSKPQSTHDSANLNNSHSLKKNKYIDNLLPTISENNSSLMKIKPAKTEITSLRILYKACISNPINTMLGNKHVWEIFCFEATDHIYIRYIKDVKIIKCSLSCFKDDNHIIYFNYPAGTTSETRRFLLKVECSNVDIYFKLRHKFFNYYEPVLVFSSWGKSKESGNGQQLRIKTTISSINQIIPVPKK